MKCGGGFTSCVRNVLKLCPYILPIYYIHIYFKFHYCCHSIMIIVHILLWPMSAEDLRPALISANLLQSSKVYHNLSINHDKYRNIADLTSIKYVLYMS